MYFFSVCGFNHYFHSMKNVNKAIDWMCSEKLPRNENIMAFKGLFLCSSIDIVQFYVWDL